jgi:hypothetical protein
MVQTIADRLGIEFERCEAMAIAADKAGLVTHVAGTVMLTGEGHERGRDTDGAACQKAAAGRWRNHRALKRSFRLAAPLLNASRNAASVWDCASPEA